MSGTRQQVLGWVERVSNTLDEAERRDAEAYQRLTPTERWERVRVACIGAQRFLTDEQRERIERRAEEDHARWGEIVRRIRARHDLGQ